MILNGISTNIKYSKQLIRNKQSVAERHALERNFANIYSILHHYSKQAAIA
jgi:hypothetical protein